MKNAGRIVVVFKTELTKTVRAELFAHITMQWMASTGLDTMQGWAKQQFMTSHCCWGDD